MVTYQETLYLGDQGDQEMHTLQVTLQRVGGDSKPSLWSMEVPQLKIREILPHPANDEKEAKAEARVLLRGKLKEANKK